MKPHGKQIQDLFDGDPGIEYHQDYQAGISPSYTRISVILPILLCCIPIVYQVLQILDYDLLPLPELFWNCIVYLTPTRFLDAIENYQNPLRISNPALKHIPRTHAAKSEVMRRILGLDVPGGIIGTVAQASRRRLSTLPGINIVSGGSDGRPAGLGNWDNSCYQNSVLQGLASLDSLSGYLTHPAFERKGPEESNMNMAEALRSLIATLNDPENNGKRIWTPATLKNMSSWQQQDAQEYFSKVLDEIDKEVGQAAKVTRRLKGFESEDSDSSSSEVSETPLSIYRNPLEGLIAQRVGCTRCGHSEGLSMIPFNCLTVPLGGAYGHDISECLDEYTKLEQIEGVECGKCTLLKVQRLLTLLRERAETSGVEKNHAYQQTRERLEMVTEALEDDDYEEKTLKKCNISSKSRVSSTKSRQAVIARPPKSLAVHFNRSLFDELTGELRKNHSEVRFPKFLDLGPWCLGSLGTTADGLIEEWLLNPDKPMVASSSQPSRLLGPIYELRAVVTHYGRHENGHYICYRKHPSGTGGEKTEKRDQWWRMSDDDVMKVSEENVLGQGGVFMLFYDQVEPAIPTLPKIAAVDMAPPVNSSVPVSAAPDSTEGIKVAEPEASDPQVNTVLLNNDDKAVLSSVVTSEPVKLIESIHPEPAVTVKIPHISSNDVVLAANTPLPDQDDSDLSSFSEDETTTSESAAPATSVSEFTDEECERHDDNYHPAKAIVVPPYIPQMGGKKGSTGSLKGSTGSLLMV
ncbi:Ubiquitin carboxyl-terminal hydrolase [Lachnellula subtilissima]|uniref:ubiquitinyl hydrolase 1 n=1 Tax=Lachnellula subtilissima TaxID=602034 RepID=A0A8H8RGX9_9HELO|nr:Ubiquitin carboxyl-terminal hydrolase [Lachnellula subtilissima]